MAYPECRVHMPWLALAGVDGIDLKSLHGLHIQLVTLAEVDHLVAHLREVRLLAGDHVREPVRGSEASH